MNLRKLVLTSVLAAVLPGICAESSAGKAADFSRTGYVSEIIPQVKDFSFNKRWEIPRLCGKHFWYSRGGRKNAPIYDMELFSYDSFSEITLHKIADYLLDPKRKYKGSCYEKQLAELVRTGKIPLLHRHIFTRAFWDEKNQWITWRAMPSREQLEVLGACPGFTGWVVSSEWASNAYVKRVVKGVQNHELEKQIMSMGESNLRGKATLELMKRCLPKSFDTRESFSQAAEKVYRGFSAPFNYLVSNAPGITSWGIQWPAVWGARSIATENRYGGISNPNLQAFSRGAGRMGNIPWGCFTGHTGDVTWSFGPFATGNRPVHEYLQMAKGTGIYPDSLMRRLWYYWCMGNTPFILDEETRVLDHDIDQNGTPNPTRYLHTIQEVVDFSNRYSDRGTPYNPVGLLLAWNNGYSGNDNPDDKAFCLFDYNDGEYMTEALLDTVIFPCEYSWSNQIDLFGVTPYGDLYDILRIDTPKGPLSLELLENYKVLFAVGEQKNDKAVARRLKDYVRQGGILILNVRQLSGELLDRDFLGVEPGPAKKTAEAMVCVLDRQKLLSGAYVYSPLVPGPESVVLYKTPDGDPVVVRSPYGKGHVITVGADWMLEASGISRKGKRPVKILPLAHDMLGRLVKQVLPFAVCGEHVRERVLYQVSRKGDGWVISLYNNAGRDSRNSREPEQVNYDYRTEVEIHVPEDIQDAVEWISRDRILLLPGRKNSRYGKMLKVALDPGEVRVVEIQPRDIPPVTVVERKNLALHCAAQASSYRKKSPFSRVLHDPSMAVNGNKEIFDGWWSEREILPGKPQWLEVDLGTVRKIHAVNTVFMWSEDNDVRLRIYQYHIDVSADGREWKKVIDETRNMSLALPRGDYRSFRPVNARYVRVSITLNTAASGGQIVELEVYGDEKAPRTYQWGRKITVPLKLTSYSREFPPEIRKAGKVLYLSDVRPAALTHPHYKLESDRNAYTRAPLRSGGRNFRKGLGSHAFSEIVYNLNGGNWKYFAAEAGIDDCSTSEASVDFVVYLDGVEKLRSGRMGLGEKPLPVWLPLKNARTLKLVIEDCGDGVIGDIADWGEARLIK